MARTRWHLVLAGLALVGAGACWWWRFERERAWLETMLANGCWPLEPVTDIFVLAWAAVVLVLVAGVMLLRAGRRMVRGSHNAAGAVLIGVAAVVLAGAVMLALAALMVPTDPLQGIDGSGLPCGGG